MDENYCDEQELEASVAYSYQYFYTLSVLFISTCVLLRLGEKNCQIKYDSFFARAIAGLLKFYTDKYHTTQSTLDIPTDKPCILVGGPHREGVLDGVVIASKLPKGMPPPRVAATTSFNVIPGFESFMNLFHVIPVHTEHPTFSSAMMKFAMLIDCYGAERHKFLPSAAAFLKLWGFAIPEIKKVNGKVVNPHVLPTAAQTLREGGCYFSFPQGNLAYINQDPHPVYNGAATLAIQENLPIYLVRIDGYWCLTNPYLPLFVKNWSWYRAILSILHPNDAKATLVIIDAHLKAEAENLSFQEKLNELNAQMFAYFLHTGDLKTEDMNKIKLEIESGKHREIWAAKMKEQAALKAHKSALEDSREMNKQLLRPTQVEIVAPPNTPASPKVSHSNTLFLADKAFIPEPSPKVEELPDESSESKSNTNKAVSNVVNNMVNQIVEKTAGEEQQEDNTIKLDRPAA